MIDTHAHVHHSKFDEDRDAVVQRAFDAGVRGMILVGTDIEESRKAIALAERYENVYAAVGIHPSFFSDRTDQGGRPILYSQFSNEAQKIEKLLSNSKVIAIGEIGLDYYSHTGRPITEKQKMVQKEGFLAQVELAKKYKLPIIIHTRPSSQSSNDAYKDIFSLLGQMSDVRGQVFILHCYQGDTPMTEKFLAMSNVYFSFAGNITYPVKKITQGTKDDICETIRLIPVDRLFVETDCPYLAPQSVRGKRNEPAYARYMYQRIAELKNMVQEDLECQIERNFEKVFSKSITKYIL